MAKKRVHKHYNLQRIRLWHPIIAKVGKRPIDELPIRYGQKMPLPNNKDLKQNTQGYANFGIMKTLIPKKEKH